MSDHGRTFKYGVFDKDGVIIDSNPLFHEKFNQVLEEQYGETIPYEEYSLVGNDFPKFMSRYIKDFSGIERFLDAFHPLSIDVSDEAGLYPDLIDVLKKLQSLGDLELFITSSSYQEAVDRMIHVHGIGEYFELARGNRGEPVDKREHFGEFAQHNNTDVETFAKHAFLVEDLPHGIEVAKSLGAFAIGITTTLTANELKAAGADVVIDSHQELLDII